MIHWSDVLTCGLFIITCGNLIAVLINLYLSVLK